MRTDQEQLKKLREHLQKSSEEVASWPPWKQDALHPEKEEESFDRKCYILRGLPGSGKSTWAAKQPNAVVVSKDHHRLVDGVYTYNPATEKEVKEKAFRAFVTNLCVAPTQNVVVDNTHLRYEQLEPYLITASNCGLEVKIVTFLCSLKDAKRNTHGVSARLLRSMALDFASDLHMKRNYGQVVVTSEGMTHLEILDEYARVGGSDFYAL